MSKVCSRSRRTACEIEIEERCQTDSGKRKFVSGGRRRKLGVRAGRQEVLHEVLRPKRWHPSARSWTEKARPCLLS